jgi:Tol biopolymer transport system component
LTAAGTASLDITTINNGGPAIDLTDPISGPPGTTTESWSADGSRLILASTATLTADDTDGGAGTDLFAVDLATGAKMLITASIPGGFEGDSWVEATSPDATKLVLGSTSTLTPDDMDAGVANDLYVYDFATGGKMLLTEPVSGPHGDTQSMGWSSDGTKLLLQSTATLTADDIDGGNGWDVYVIDAATGAKTLLTASLPGGAEGSFSPASWSPHGSDLVIQSTATLTADDTDGGSGGWDLYLVDAATTAKTLLTAPVAGGSEGSSQFGAWSPDGSKIAFTSSSALTSDAPNDQVWDVYVADVATGQKTLLTAPIAGGHDNSDFAGWSPDSSTVLVSTASTLTADDTDGESGLDLYAVNVASGAKTLLTQSVPGGAEGDSWLEGWSPDGSKIVIGSQSTLTADDTDGGAGWDLYVVDLTSGQKTLLTAPVAGGADGQFRFAGFSPDGSKILLASTATLTADDTNGSDWDLFSFDLTTGTKTLLTAPVAGGVEGDSDFVSNIAHGSSPEPVWSADGHSVRIVTSASLVNADADNGGEDLYWVDATTGAKTFTDLGIDQQPGQFAWAEAAGPDSPTLVGIATDVSHFYLLV